MEAQQSSTSPPPSVSIAMIKAVAAELDADRRTDLLAATRRTRAVSAEQAGDLSTAIHMADLRRDKPAPEGALQERTLRELLQQARMPTIVAVRRVTEKLDAGSDAGSREVLLKVTSAMLEGPATLPEPEPEPEEPEPESQPELEEHESQPDASQGDEPEAPSGPATGSAPQLGVTDGTEELRGSAEAPAPAPADE